MRPNEFEFNEEQPIQIEPDDPNEILDDHTIFRRKARPYQDLSELKREPAQEKHADDCAQSSSMQGQALQWALDVMHEPAMAAADWLARDIDPSQPSAVALLTNPDITLAQIRQAKSVFKTMRIVGEKAADRRTGARMYAVAIAAALVRFGEKISTQSNDALDRGFQGVINDRRMPEEFRNMAGKAICVLRDLKDRKNFGDSARSKSA